MKVVVQIREDLIPKCPSAISLMCAADRYNLAETLAADLGHRIEAHVKGDIVYSDDRGKYALI